MPFIQIYEFNAAAVVHRSQFNPAPMRDPLEVARVLADFQRKKNFDRHWYCRKCNAWTEGRRNKQTNRRPPGVTKWDACNGCVLSHLDMVNLSPSALAELRDRLAERWILAREQSVRHLFTKHHALKPKARARWETEQAKLDEAVDDAFEDCRKAGFNPARRRRRKTTRSGDAPPEVQK